MCASYIHRGRVTEFVLSDVAPAQLPPAVRTQPFPGMLSAILSLSPSSGAPVVGREARNQSGDRDGPRGCKAS